MDSAIVAKQIKAALKSAFPGTKFSVRSHKYSMGQSVRVEWQDGPSTMEVQNITDGFQQVSRDEMGEILSGGNLFVMITRKISDELKAWAESFYQECYECYADNNPEWRKQEIIRGIANFEPQFTARYVYFTEHVEEPLESVEAESVEPVEANKAPVVGDKYKLIPVQYTASAKFADLNKNDSIMQYLEQVEAGDFSIYSMEVGHEIKLNTSQWNELMNSLLDSRFPKELDKAILVTCGWQKVLIYTSGYTYARYVGLDVQVDKVNNVIQFPNAG